MFLTSNLEKLLHTDKKSLRSTHTIFTQVQQLTVELSFLEESNKHPEQITVATHWLVEYYITILGGGLAWWGCTEQAWQTTVMEEEERKRNVIINTWSSPCGLKL